MLIPHQSDFVATASQQHRTWRWQEVRNQNIWLQLWHLFQTGYTPSYSSVSQASCLFGYTGAKLTSPQQLTLLQFIHGSKIRSDTGGYKPL
jgi:hypothetical protein